MTRPRFIVSACLAGIACRYDGRANTCDAVVRMVAEGRAVPACPECLGGLPTPRTPSEIVHDKVMTRDGHDVTRFFRLGAQVATELARKHDCSAAILKSRSPSCGCGQVYDGTFSKCLCEGDGIWAAQLREAGFALFSEECLPPEEQG